MSSKRRNLHVEVMEPVRGLTIQNCCEAAIPVGVKRTFVASVVKGKPVEFLWTFDLHERRAPETNRGSEVRISEVMIDT